MNYTGQRSGSIGTSNSSVGNMFAVSGRRPQDNLFLLNGIEYTGASLINVTPGGTSGQLLGVDAVREFNVVTDTYSAAYGKRDGAQISIVTASGTNHLHGSAYEFLRNSFFDARNYFDQSRIPEFQRNNFGASLGGPIRKDKLFLFGNYEGYRQNLGLSDVTLVPDNSLPRRRRSPPSSRCCNLWPVANGPELLDASGKPTGIAYAYSIPTQHIREDFGTTRFDYNISRQRPPLRRLHHRRLHRQHAHTKSLLAHRREPPRAGRSACRSSTSSPPHLLNTARFGYSRATFYFLGSIPADIQAITSACVPGKPIGAIVIAGSTASNGSSQITAAGANVGSNNAITRNLFTFDDHIFWTIGRHQIEAGGWLQRLQSNDNLAQNQYGQASFASLATFLARQHQNLHRRPIAHRARLALTLRRRLRRRHLPPHAAPRTPRRLPHRIHQRLERVARPRRASIVFTNGVINTNPTVQLRRAHRQPRACSSPSPASASHGMSSATASTSIRAGFGLHHSLLDNLDYRLDQAAPFNTTSRSRTPGTSRHITPTTRHRQHLISPSNVQTDIATPAVLVSWTLRIEQRARSATTSLTVGYVGSHSYHQILSEDLNEPASITAQRCPERPRPSTTPTTTKANPALANTTSWVSQGISNYNALVVDLRRNLTHGLQLPRQLHLVQEPRQRLRLEHQRQRQHPRLRLRSLQPRISTTAPPPPTSATSPPSTPPTICPSARPSHLSHLHGFSNRAISGWTLAAIATLQTGFPFTPQLGYNPTGSGDTRNPVRPDINPNFHGNLYTPAAHPPEPVLQSRTPSSHPPTAPSATSAATPSPAPAYRNLDLSLAQSPPRSPNASAPAVPRRVLQHPQPHQPAHTQRSRLLLRPHAGKRRQPNQPPQSSARPPASSPQPPAPPARSSSASSSSFEEEFEATSVARPQALSRFPTPSRNQ